MTAATTKDGIGFVKESSLPFDLPSTSNPPKDGVHSSSPDHTTATTTIDTYRLNSNQTTGKGNGMRVVFVPLPGPLVSCSILVPTISTNHKGLPHTLEHLVFCGSQSIPNRGYLDVMATRCLSTGTNAYTCEDHTCYELNTAGSEGMISILPVFLDHILHPTLRPRQFMTEVFHVDGEGKHQGVVTCEMASREHSEMDLLDLELRQAVFQNTTTYAYECGGKTTDIAQLSNEEIIAYHARFYSVNHVTILLCGNIEPSAVFNKLLAFPSLFASNPVADTAEVESTFESVPQSFAISTPPPMNVGLTARSVQFPSSDQSVGSIAYGWRGPTSVDAETCLALDILFRYWTETAASPLNQTFVECENPIASQVYMEYKSYVHGCVVAVFSGVATSFAEEDEDEDDGDHSDEDSGLESDDGSEDPSETASSSGHKCTHMYLEEGNTQFHALLVETLTQELKHDGILHSLRRHRRKLYEMLEEDAHELCAASIAQDVIYRAAYTSPDSEACLQPIGSKVVSVFHVLEKLVSQPIEYWKDLVKTWFLDAPVVEIKMIPDTELAKTLAAQESSSLESRRAKLGPEGLAIAAAEVKAALEENAVNLPESLLSTMPPIPRIEKVSKFDVASDVVSVDKYGSPFQAVQVIRTETVFSSVRFAFNISNLPFDLKPYLVLFQELLFQTDIEHPVLGRLDYRQVSSRAADLLVSFSSSVGLGNELWSASWLSEVFFLSASCECLDLEESTIFLLDVLFYSCWTKERLLSIIRNLLSDLTEAKRSGPGILSAILTHTLCSRGRGEKETRSDPFISIFQQEAFLKQLLKRLMHEGNSAAQDIFAHLDRLRTQITSSGLTLQGKYPGFARISIPRTGTGLHVTSESSDIPGAVTAFLIKSWDAHVQRDILKSPKNAGNVARSQPFPFPRDPLSMPDLEFKFGQSIVVPIHGLSTSYLTMVVECDICQPFPHPDYYPVVVLAELLSRSEGPLYTAIRGQGFAYGANMHLAMWNGQLSFEVYDSSEPYKALEAFYDILDSLGAADGKGLNDLCSDFNLSTTFAAVGYRLVSEMSSAGSIVSTALRSSLLGCTAFPAQYEATFPLLYQVKREDILRVYKRYFSLFLNPSVRVSVMTTVPGEACSTVTSAFSANANHLRRVDFKLVGLSDFQGH